MYKSVYEKRGVVVRYIYITISIVVYILTFGCRFFKKKGVVLCYHGIPFEHKDKFAWQVNNISKNFSNNVQLTFDDAFENLFENGLPILKKNKIPAVIFVVSGNLGESPKWNFLSDHPDSNESIVNYRQLSEISKEQLFCIGSHTLTHKDLANIDEGDARGELVRSKNDLESLIGFPVTDFAFPYGSCSKDLINEAIAIGYKRIYTLQPKLMSSDELEKGVIGRFSMTPDVYKIEFLLTCSGAYCWLGKFRMLISYAKKIKNHIKLYL